MTDRELMKQALEGWDGPAGFPKLCKAMEAMRERLAQPELEPTCPECKAAVLYECVACSSNNYPPAAQPEQEPVAFYHPRNGFYWAKPTSIFAPTSVDVEPLPLYASPPAAQRPWVGLTDEERDSITGKVIGWNSCCGWEDAYAQAIEAKLKEKNDH
jgi:hypothetical protein